MHLRRVHITNVRSIAELTWELPDGVDGAGWHVILGDNGSGKSTFLRSIALALVGDENAAALRQPWDDWMRAGASSTSIELIVRMDPQHDPTPDGAAPTKTTAEISVSLHRSFGGPVRRHAAMDGRARLLWDPEPGWFSASYGPFRRFTGGDADLQKLYATQPRLARHLSLFGEAVALTEALTWLQNLKFMQLERKADGDLLAPIKAFINQPGFLPNDVRFEDVSSSGVDFVDANGVKVPVQNLSDGYRSILSMTLELVRQMALTYGGTNLFSADGTHVVPPGVVIIDEVDAHLHPTWQRTIGVWFRKHFPNVQFIVSTHSPLICQAAEHGTVYRLPQPGTEDVGGMVEGTALNRLLYGNVLDAYGTGVFGDGVTRSDSGQAKLEQLAELNIRERDGELSDDERQAQTELRETLPTEASTTQTP